LIGALPLEHSAFCDKICIFFLFVNSMVIES